LAWTNLSEDIAAEFGALEQHEASLEPVLERVRAYKLAELRKYHALYRWQHKTHHTPKNKAIYPPGVAHLHAARAYQARHLAAGLCIKCPRPATLAFLCRPCADKKNSRTKRNRKGVRPAPVARPCACGRAMLPARGKSCCVNCLADLRAAYIAKRNRAKLTVCSGTSLAVYSPC
jgi:hypothetical protein